MLSFVEIDSSILGNKNKTRRALFSNYTAKEEDLRLKEKLNILIPIECLEEFLIKYSAANPITGSKQDKYTMKYLGYYKTDKIRLAIELTLNAKINLRNSFVIKYNKPSDIDITTLEPNVFITGVGGDIFGKSMFIFSKQI